VTLYLYLSCNERFNDCIKYKISYLCVLFIDMTNSGIKIPIPANYVIKLSK